jgi:hypothetical protein
MSLILALVSLAWADRIYWVSPPSPADSDAASRTLPGAESLPLEGLVSSPAAGDPAAAIELLRSELAAVRPLLAEFDGELQIMARLSKATADVTVLRSEADAALLFSAQCFLGNAVHRYFGDRLWTDSTAAPYRTVVGPAVLPAAWVDAVALGGTANPDAADVPEKPQRLGYDGVRALVGAMPAASFEIGSLAEGAEVWLDGKAVAAKSGTRTLLVPGRHFFSVRVGDVALLSGDARLSEGATMRAEAPFGPRERDSLVKLLDGRSGWPVPAAAQVPIAGAEMPVYLAVPGQGKPRLVRVDRGTAESVELVAPARAAAPPFAVHVGAGVGWASTGDWFLQNVSAGAPYDKTSVNAVAPAFEADVAYRTGLFAASVGLSAQVATGDFHELPTGNDTTRTFLYPHVGVGLPWVQATIGPMFPWYVGVGAKARVPVTAGLEVVGNAVYGVGMEVARAEGEPAFQPLPAIAAWAGAGWRFD